jgi:hypothetical protein
MGQRVPDLEAGGVDDLGAAGFPVPDLGAARGGLNG